MLIRFRRTTPTSSQVRQFAAKLNSGLPVVLPTETQYALACDATSRIAIESVRAIKGRAKSAPFSVFMPGADSLANWNILLPESARDLADRFWPGPLTLILPTSNPLFKLLGGNGRTVGVRVTPEPMIRMLLESTKSPLVATSANPSGIVMNSRAENNWLEQQADAGLLVWARPERYIRRPASTIIDCTGNVPRELRSGPISKAVWNAALRTDV